MQQKAAKILEGEAKLPSTMTMNQRQEMNDMAYRTLYLHLSENVLRQITGIAFAATICKKLIYG